MDVFKHHCINIDDKHLERAIRGALCIMYDGTTATHVFGGVNIAVGSWKVTGFKDGYRSSTSTAGYFMVSNKSENDTGTKAVLKNEIKKLERVRTCKPLEMYDQHQRLHVISPKEMMIVKIMDMKASNDYLDFVPASSKTSEPYISILKRCDKNEDDDDYKYQKKYAVHGYEQCSIFDDDMGDLNKYIPISPSCNYEGICNLLKEAVGTEQYILCTNWYFLAEKIKCLLEMWTVYNAQCVDDDIKLDEDDRIDWMKKTAKERLKIGFWCLPAKEDLENFVVALLHLEQRTADKYGQYFNSLRRVWRIHPVEEINYMIKIPQLKSIGEQYKKLDDKLSMMKNININLNGNKIKVISGIFNEICCIGNQRICDMKDDEDDDDETDTKHKENKKKLMKIMNIIFLFYWETSMKYIALVREDENKSEYPRDEAQFIDLYKKGILVYFTFFDCICIYHYVVVGVAFFQVLPKWIRTPTTFRTFITLPFSHWNMKVINHRDKRDVCYADFDDQIMEHMNKNMKDSFARNGNNRFGSCVTLMDNYMFPFFGNLDYDRKIFKNKRKSKEDDLKIYNGEFDVSGFDDFAQGIMKKLRNGQKLTDEYKLLFENDRIKSLEKCIEDYYNGTLEEQKDIEDILCDENEEHIIPSLPTTPTNNNKNKKRTSSKKRSRSSSTKKNKNQPKKKKQRTAKPALKTA